MWEIFVEKFKVDVPENLSAQLNFNVDDIREFGFRDTNYSKTIVLPGTSNNKKIFGHIFDAGASNISNPANPNVGYDFDATRSAKCLLFVDQIQQFKGVLTLVKTVEMDGAVEFEVLLLGELGGLISAMANKRLEDLDFSAYNHLFNLVNIQNSWTSPIGSGYYYPLIDYGYSQEKTNFPIENFRPALHVREYVDKIFAAAGYTFTSAFMDLPYFKKQIIPFNGDYMKRETTADAHHSFRSASYLLGGSGSAWNSLPATMSQTIVSTLFDYDSAVTYKQRWNSTEGFRGLFTLSLNWTKLDSTPMLFSIGIVRDTNYTEIWFSGTLTGTSGTISAEFSADVAPRDIFKIKMGHNGGSTTQLTMTNIRYKIKGQPTLILPVAIGNTVVMADVIPKNFFQTDLIKALIKMYNLYITEDKDKANHLNIAPYVYYYGTDVENWDDKLDRSKAITYKPMGELNSRSYEFKWQDDSDYYNEYYRNRFSEGYGSFVHDTGFQFAKDKSTVQVCFAGTPIVQFSNNDRCLSTIVKKSDAGVYSRIAHKPRIMFRSTGLVPCQPWWITYFYGTPSLSQLITGGYPYAGHLDDIDAPLNDLNWGAPKEFYFTILSGWLSSNLFNVFWSVYISEISDKNSKLLTANLKLSTADIYQLDFSRPKYINGQLWRLNKVIDHSTDKAVETTKCEFLKVIDLES